MAKLYKVSGEIKNVFPENGNDFSLKELQSMVGGYIEVVPVNDGQLIVVDEEGRLKGYEHNQIASNITRGQVIGDIVGNMLLCNQNEIK